MHFAHYRLHVQANKRKQHDIHVYQTLRFAEILRKIVMGMEGRRNNGKLTPVFSARDEEGNILRRGSHEHCFILPLDENRDGYIDEVLLFSPMGFPLSLLSVLSEMEENTFFGAYELKLQSVSHHIPEHLHIFSKTWHSATPFLTRRSFRESRDGEREDWLKGEIRRLFFEVFGHLEDIGMEIRFVSPPRLSVPNDSLLYWQKFERRRKNERIAYACGIEIEFDMELPFPLVFGEFCHYGMGRLTHGTST
jgi:CRISPR-associated protein Csb2